VAVDIHFGGIAGIYALTQRAYGAPLSLRLFDRSGENVAMVTIMLGDQVRVDDLVAAINATFQVKKP
jgi:hypothetical protein